MHSVAFVYGTAAPKIVGGAVARLRQAYKGDLAPASGLLESRAMAAGRACLPGLG